MAPGPQLGDRWSPRSLQAAGTEARCPRTPASACPGDPLAAVTPFPSALSLALQPVSCSQDWSVVGTALQT